MSCSSGKKGKKKVKTVPLNEFLGPSDGFVMMSSSSWAAEVDSAENSNSLNSGPVKKVSLPSAPRSSRPLELDSAIPSRPPYAVRLSNLSFEVQEEDVEQFFSEMKVVSIRLLRENNEPTGRINGTGFVEFEDRESLILALTMPKKNLMNRILFIDISDGDSRQRRQRAIDDIKRSLPGDEDDRTSGDWRTTMPRSSSPSRDGRRNDWANDRGARGDRYDGGRGDRYDGGRGDRYDGGRGDRYDGGRGDRYDGGRGDRYDGGRGDRYDGGRGDRYDGGRGDRYDGGRGDRYDGGRGDRYDGGRDRRDGGFSRNYNNRDEGGPRRSEFRRDDDFRRGDGGDRDFQRRDDFSRRGDGYGRRDEDSSEQSEPPKLVLEKKSTTAEESSVPVRSAAIFGQARPVDTSKKEKEIEERLKSQKPVEAPAPRSAPKASYSSIFGDAKPVDTRAKEKEIDERLMKINLEKGQLDEGEGEKKRQHHRGGGREGGSYSRSSHRENDSRRESRGGDYSREHDKSSTTTSSPPPPQNTTSSQGIDNDDDPESFIGSNKYSTLEGTE